jgi:outer membrane protein assembly factor BamD (BamD/ComL family)
MLALDSLLKNFPDHSLVDDALYKESKIFDIKRNYTMEDSLLKTIVEKYADGVIADDALFNRSELYETKLSDKTKAMELYQDLLTKFPGSLYCVEARKKFRKLRGDTAP